MKKLLAVVLVAAITVGIGFAADIATVTTKSTSDRYLKESVQIDMNTIRNKVNTNTAQMVYGGTNVWLIQCGTATGKQVVTFPTVFAAAPYIYLTPTGAVTAGNSTNLVPTTSNARTNFTTAVLDMPGFNWMAIGPK